MKNINSSKFKTIAFQGMAGAYSDLACRAAYPELTTLPCVSFEAAFRAVSDGAADLAMIPVDNSLAGRVADVHNLIPNENLHIIGEHFQLIRHCLLGLPDADLEDFTDVHSHVHAIPQCKKIIDELRLTRHVVADTAKGAFDVKKWNDKSQAVIASELAADIYGLKIFKRDIQDAAHNTTRFLVFSREHIIPVLQRGATYKTSFIFEVRNIPAALYKALGGFATNGIQMSKLESYVDKDFNIARFYADVEGHVEEPSLQLALEELHFFAKLVVMLGTYPVQEIRDAARSDGDWQAVN